MASEKTKQCKTKGCSNLVLDGKHCEYCRQKRKENSKKLKALLGSVVIIGSGTAIKKVGIKQIFKFAGKAGKMLLREKI